MLSTLILYSITWFAVSVMPGPSMMLMLANGLTKNKRLVIMGMLGANLSSITIISAVAVGLGALLQASEALFSLIKWIGVAYLLWLAWQMWHAEPKAIETTAPRETPFNKAYTPLQAFRRCLLVGITNPKGILFFTAFLPQFIHISQPQIPQYAALAVITVVIDSACMVCYAAGGMQAAKLLTGTNLKRLNRCSAIIMTCMAGGLALYRKS
jgi:threonine/homoserine/homoserine lactone efflux protein